MSSKNWTSSFDFVYGLLHFAIMAARPIAISAHHCCADQKTLHLGPFDQRHPFLSAPGFACPTVRLDAASPNVGNCGLDEYVLAISEAVATITTAAQGAKPSLIGHSLGGTLAAMYRALLPESIRSLVLLGAPLCFEPSKNHFRDALVTLVPQEISDADPFPGSLLSHASALASPRAFIWSRLMDPAMSIADPLAMAIHARVERWALDEMPLPGKLVHQIIEWLYRENRFCSNELKIGGKFIGPSTLPVPTLAVLIPPTTLLL
jgi:polyhydroxyalkanoate synthase subunit PhaC